VHSQARTETADLQAALTRAAVEAAMPDEVTDEQGATGAGKKGAQKEKRAVSPLTGAPVPKGRTKGTPNKLTTSIRDAVMTAFNQVGGAQYLVKLANGTQSDRAAFTSLLNKVLPTQINANVEGGIQVQLSWLGSRSIGTTTAQPAEVITQVVDLERDSAGKYRMIDQKAAPAGGGGGDTGAGQTAGADGHPGGNQAQKARTQQNGLQGANDV